MPRRQSFFHCCRRDYLEEAGFFARFTYVIDAPFRQILFSLFRRHEIRCSRGATALRRQITTAAIALAHAAASRLRRRRHFFAIFTPYATPHDCVISHCWLTAQPAARCRQPHGYTPMILAISLPAAASPIG